MTTCNSYECQKYEQCDDCFLIDHMKDCAGCDHYDHPEVTNKKGLVTVRPERGDFSAKKLMNTIIFGDAIHFHQK